MAFAPIATSDEVKIVAMIARGDKYKDIQANLQAAGSHVGMDTIVAIKKRNKENLAMLKTKLIEIETIDAMEIKQKANSLLKKRLDDSDMQDEIIAKAHQDYLDDKITFKEYIHIVDRLKETTVPELVMVSKEMHNQSKIEPDAPTRNPENLKALAEAIEKGDEMILNQLIFKKGESNATVRPPEEQHVQTDDAS